MTQVLILIVIFVISFFLVIKGGNIIVSFCEKLSDITGLSEFLIGSTLTSVATFLPELFVTILSIKQGLSEVAIGSIFGNIFINIGVILASILISQKLNRVYKKTQNELIYMSLLITFVLVLVMFKILNIFAGILLMILFLIYFISIYDDAKNELLKKNKLVYNKIDKNYAQSIYWQILKFVIGLFLVCAGVQLILSASQTLNKLINISYYATGFIIISIGTSFPELVTSQLFLKRKRRNLAIGNIVGSTILNLTLNCGLAGLLCGTKSLIISFDKLLIIGLLLIFSLIVLVIPILLKNKTYKSQGIILTSIYAICCIIIILLK